MAKKTVKKKSVKVAPKAILVPVEPLQITLPKDVLELGWSLLSTREWPISMVNDIVAFKRAVEIAVTAAEALSVEKNKKVQGANKASA